jgi:hypothetical protein
VETLPKFDRASGDPAISSKANAFVHFRFKLNMTFLYAQTRQIMHAFDLQSSLMSEGEFL